MKKSNLFVFTFSVMFLFACNPFPKEDTHPEVPLLVDLLKDKSKFKKIVDMENLSEIIFLKNDRILLKPDNSNLPFKIIGSNNELILEEKYDWNVPFYIDKQGDLYFNRQKYYYPDYKRHENFRTIVFSDSLSQKSEEVQNLNDSVGLQVLKDYEIELLKPFGLSPCDYTIINTERCDVFEVRDNTLIVRQNERFKIDFLKPKNEIPKFDDDVLISWHNGKLPNPVYLAYYKINNIKFKCHDTTYPKTVLIDGKMHIYAYGLGVYQLL